MPGPQLLQAIPLTRSLKERFPGLHIIWGGYFPSLHARTVLESGFVDFVIRGQGELSFLELVEALEANASYDHIPGLSFRREKDQAGRLAGVIRACPAEAPRRRASARASSDNHG